MKSTIFNLLQSFSHRFAVSALIMGLSTAVSGLLNCTVFIGSSGFTVLYGRLADGFGWTCSVVAWVACGVVAAVACLAGSGTWKRKRPEA